VFTWPRKALEHLHEVERLQHIESRKTRSVLRTPLFWMVSIQFAFIAGSEAGVTSTLPAFIEQHREPLLGLSARDWSQVVLVTMLLGIVAGRFAAFWLSHRINERGIYKNLPCMHGSGDTGGVVAMVGDLPSVLFHSWDYLLSDLASLFRFGIAILFQRQNHSERCCRGMYTRRG